MNRKLLVDTSIWIEYFLGRLPDAAAIERGLGEGTVFVTGPIVAELLQGVRTAAEAERLRRCIDAIPYVECRLEDWLAAGETGFALRRKGIVVPLTDLVIAMVARRIGAMVHSLDKHFAQIDNAGKI
ncbi:MAG: PIN domain-containing protein [Patescibacteria group bacterium]